MYIMEALQRAIITLSTCRAITKRSKRDSTTTTNNAHLAVLRDAKDVHALHCD